MKRREFIKVSGMLGLSSPLSSILTGCTKTPINSDSVGKVIIIGAGAAGLCAGYLLQQQGIAFDILEASSVYGGRMKRTTEFANFPIPLGAEWIHVDSDILNEIVNDESVKVDIKTTLYAQTLIMGCMKVNALHWHRWILLKTASSSTRLGTISLSNTL